MNIKSLLLGSAAALVAVTGARAADAVVVVPEPEPVEYVRVCDIYGAGFFYIPGTETCLAIGGYMRYQIHYQDQDIIGDDFWKFARFQLNVDARSESEWGTLRGYAEGRFDWHSLAGNSAYVNQVFIELIQGAGTIRLGKTDTLYARFLGYGTPFGPFDGSYAFNNTGELSYTYNAGAFSAALGVIELGYDSDFDVGIEGGVKFTGDSFWIGAMAGYDMFTDEWGAKARAEVSFAPITVGAMVFYSSGPSVYQILSPAGGVSEISAAGYAKVDVTESLAIAGAVQWFDDTPVFADDVWQFTAGLDWRPIWSGGRGLRIRPEVQYTTEIEQLRVAVRFDRAF
jgi:opacity protein-like surface antigen